MITVNVPALVRLPGSVAGVRAVTSGQPEERGCEEEHLEALTSE